MRNKTLFRLIVLAYAFALVAPAQDDEPKIKMPSWAFHIPDGLQPKAGEIEGKVPGSSKTYTGAQISDLNNPPDWFPDEHGAVPSIIQHGKDGALACGSCHLMSGRGHPESADLAGLPVEYLVRQMADFKSGARKDPARMSAIAQGLSADDARQAAEWFASLKPGPWVRVVEADNVPKTYVSGEGRMRLIWKGQPNQPIGSRIIELPEDPDRALSRDPHSGFVAYVPKGSIAKGEALAKTGGSGRTIACGICHGDSLQGIGDVPRLAGLHPDYIVRQLWFFSTKAYTGTSSALMKKVARDLTEGDMIALAAYAASLPPGPAKN